MLFLITGSTGQEVTLLRQQLEEHGQRSVESDGLLAQLNEEAQGLRAELREGAQERQELTKAVQSLRLSLASAQSEHRAALNQLHQEALDLQQELALTHNTCTLKDQVRAESNQVTTQYILFSFIFFHIILPYAHERLLVEDKAHKA